MDPRVLDLLLRFEELAEEGKVVSLEELCKDAPHLLGELKQHLQNLGQINACLGLANTRTHEGNTSPPCESGEQSADAVLPPLTASGLRYSRLSFHAQGGLGKVFKAHDEELHREVAVKAISPTLDHDDGARRRFLQEAEITARLEHPGVVPVHGLVRDSEGRPFYAMRFIRGESLKSAIDRFHQADGPVRDAGERNLAFRNLLGRFGEVCNTIAYAHSRGIIHRDLKPNNVMLGKYGETLVVDWGLAKPIRRTEAQRQATGEETLRPSSRTGEETQMGQVVGTPAYMSPEQAAGRWNVVGPASDIYGLGAILYAILTGRAPVAGGDSYEILSKVQRGDFPRPRQVKPSVPAALEAICLRAMSLEPDKRYASALELAADIERWLADEPGTWPESWGIRARRWLRRRRTLVASVSMALVAAILIGGVAFSLAQRQKQARQKQIIRTIQLNPRSSRAYDGLGMNLLYQGKPKEAEPAIRQALALQPWCSWFHAHLGRSLGARKDYRGAEAAFREAIRLQPDEGFFHDYLGHVFYNRGGYAESIAHYREAVRLKEAKFGPDHTNTLTSREYLANAYRSAGRADDAIRLHEQILKQQEVKPGPNSPATLHTMKNLSLDYRAKGRLKDAISLLETAIQRGRQHSGGLPALLDSVPGELAEIYEQDGQFAKAESIFRDSLGNARWQYGSDDPRTAGVLVQLGGILLKQKKFRDAEPLLRQCLAIRDKKQPDDWTTFNARSLLGEALLGLKKYAEAEPLLVQGYEGMKKRQDKISPPYQQLRLSEALERLVRLYEATEQKAKAADWRKKLNEVKAEQKKTKS